MRCEREETSQYAGMCWSAAARCEGSLGNTPAEAWDLVRAGRQYLSAETKSAAIGCPSAGSEYLQVLRNINKTPSGYYKIRKLKNYVFLIIRHQNILVCVLHIDQLYIVHSLENCH